jgi:hypothetical protein
VFPPGQTFDRLPNVKRRHGRSARHRRSRSVDHAEAEGQTVTKKQTLELANAARAAKKSGVGIELTKDSVIDAAEHFGKLFGCPRTSVIYARALLRSDPDSAAKVKAVDPQESVYDRSTAVLAADLAEIGNEKTQLDTG